MQLQDAASFLRSLNDRELLRFLVRYSWELTIAGRATYTPGSDSLSNPQALRAYNEVMHRALEHANRCLSGEERRPPESLAAVLLGDGRPGADGLVSASFQRAARHCRTDA